MSYAPSATKSSQVLALLHFAEGVVGADGVIRGLERELLCSLFDAGQALEIVFDGEAEAALFGGAGGQAVAHQVLLELAEELGADLEHFLHRLRLHREEEHLLDVLLGAGHVLAAAHHVEGDIGEVERLRLLRRKNFPRLEAARLEQRLEERGGSCQTGVAAPALLVLARTLHEREVERRHGVQDVRGGLDDDLLRQERDDVLLDALDGLVVRDVDGLVLTVRRPLRDAVALGNRPSLLASGHLGGDLAFEREVCVGGENLAPFEREIGDNRFFCHADSLQVWAAGRIALSQSARQLPPLAAHGKAVGKRAPRVVAARSLPHIAKSHPAIRYTYVTPQHIWASWPAARSR
jgi:hypothetical protein